MSARPKTLAIIGGGFSGTVTAVHLLRGTPKLNLQITLIDPAPQLGRGLAYRFDDDNLLLNVPAGNMSALADEPEHFVAYCQTIDPAITARSFVSRRLYGDYLQHTLSQARHSHPGMLQTVADTAIAITRDAPTGSWRIKFSSGAAMAADQVVLALGHQASRFPLALETEAQTHIIDPWDLAALQRLPPDAPVVILGTSHTAVDTLFNLTRIHRQRPVWMVSRRGLVPHGHRLNPQAPTAHGQPAYLQGLAPTLRASTRALRLEIARQHAAGVDWRDVLNDLRPHTAALWQAMPVAERRTFLRHLQPYWDVHRHRLAPMAAHRLHALLYTGQVQVLAGRVLSVQSQGSGEQTPPQMPVQVQVRHRGTGICQTVHAAAIVNCTGPSGNIQHQPQPLLQQLLQAGLVQADACGLGLLVATNRQVLGSNNAPVSGLWYVGPLLKAQHWEATAVPELRSHAAQLAQTLEADQWPK